MHRVCIFTGNIDASFVNMNMHLLPPQPMPYPVQVPVPVYPIPPPPSMGFPAPPPIPGFHFNVYHSGMPPPPNGWPIPIGYPGRGVHQFLAPPILQDYQPRPSPPLIPTKNLLQGTEMTGNALLSFLRTQSTRPAASEDDALSSLSQNLDKLLLDDDDLPSAPEPVPQKIAVAASEAGEETAAPTTKVSHIHRHVRNQMGVIRMSITTGNQRQIFPSRLTIRPNAAMTVHWELPAEVFDAPEKPDIVVGLARLGAFLNHPCIVAKSISKEMKRIPFRNAEGFGGTLPYYTPRASGRFVFRLYDQSTTERSRVTLATSMPFVVELDEPNFNLAIKFVNELFDDKEKDKNAPLKACNQLVSLIFGIGERCVHARADLTKIRSSLSKCVERIVRLLHSGIESLRVNLSIPEEERNQSQLEAIKFARNIQNDGHEVFEELRRNPMAWALIDPELQRDFEALEENFCPLLQRYFADFNELRRTRNEVFGFNPFPPQAIDSISPSILELFSENIQILAKSLIPDASFGAAREEVRRRIQSSLTENNIVPTSSEIALFGSSINNFGSYSADVDMCVILPKSHLASSSTPQEKGKLMERVGEHLRSIGMIDVEVIATARIPVVNFRDPKTGSLSSRRPYLPSPRSYRIGLRYNLQ